MSDFRFALVAIPASFFYFIKKLNWLDWVNLLALVLILVGITWCLDAGYYMGKWLAISGAIVVVLGGAIYEKYGLACASLITYLCGSALWVLMANSRYSTLNPYDLLGLRYFSADSLAKLLMVVLPFLFWRQGWKEMRALGRLVIATFCLISLFQVFWEWAWFGCAVPNSCGGALRNPSLNDSMLAVCLPILAHVLPYGWAFVVPVALASMAGKSAIGIGMCALYVAVLLWSKIKGRWKWPAVLSSLPAILALGYLTHGHKVFFDSSGRFQMWVFFMKLWAVNWRNVVTGTGFGTFGVFSQNLQQHFIVNPTDWWIWMHNDWLQMAFECGIIGLALMCWMYATCVWRLRRSAPEMQSLLLFGVMMGCEYSLHVAPPSLYAAWIAALALMQTKNSDDA